MIMRVSLIVASICGATTAFGDCPTPELGTAEIYPTAKVVPENLLRMYVYYPRAMAVSGGLSDIRLLDEDGLPVDGVFLPTREDLWSQDRRRLTLLFDPGRVKTGLEASEALGRALKVGRSYTFEVLGTAVDASGCVLGKSTRYGFKVGPADLEPPDPDAWTLVPPMAGTREPLQVGLGSPHDHLSLAFRLRIRDAAGALVPGQISLGAAEESWEFVPRTIWAEEDYNLTIEGNLEDLAGNRPGALFDQPAGQALKPSPDSLTFRAKATR